MGTEEYLNSLQTTLMNYATHQNCKNNIWLTNLGVNIQGNQKNGTLTTIGERREENKRTVGIKMTIRVSLHDNNETRKKRLSFSEIWNTSYGNSED